MSWQETAHALGNRDVIVDPEDVADVLLDPRTAPIFVSPAAIDAHVYKRESGEYRPDEVQLTVELTKPRPDQAKPGVVTGVFALGYPVAHISVPAGTELVRQPSLFGTTVSQTFDKRFDVAAEPEPAKRRSLWARRRQGVPSYTVTVTEPDSNPRMSRMSRFTGVRAGDAAMAAQMAPGLMAIYRGDLLSYALRSPRISVGLRR